MRSKIVSSKNKFKRKERIVVACLMWVIVFAEKVGKGTAQIMLKF